MSNFPGLLSGLGHLNLNNNNASEISDFPQNWTYRQKSKPETEDQGTPEKTGQRRYTGRGEIPSLMYSTEPTALELPSFCM
jgi:hypothetical protein